MSWLELSVSCDPEAVESVSELLTKYGYNGGVVVDQPIIPGADGPDFTYDLSKPVTLRTYLPVDDRSEEVRSQVAEALWHLGRMRPIGDLQVRQLEEADWANAWKQYYGIMRIGERTVIVPSWLDYTSQPHEIVLRLDPGMAFGTGLHPTTRLCLAIQERYVQPSQVALDLGCGSGILAIQIAHLGAQRVLAIDTDPIAVDATRENIERNQVQGRVIAAEGSLGRGVELGHWLNPDSVPPTVPVARIEIEQGPQFQLIAANLIANVLVFLADEIAAALAPAGILISSGIFIDREDEVAVAFAAVGLERLERHQDGDWVALVHQKPA